MGGEAGERRYLLFGSRNTPRRFERGCDRRGAGPEQRATLGSRRKRSLKCFTVLAGGIFNPHIQKLPRVCYQHRVKKRSRS